MTSSNIIRVLSMVDGKNREREMDQMAHFHEIRYIFQMNFPQNIAPYEILGRGATSFGIFFCVSLPSENGAIPDKIWKKLHHKEQALARKLKGLKKISFVGGRLAAKHSLQSIQKEHLPVETDPFGAPTLPTPLSVSISHKRDIAIALLSRQEHVTVGIDIENLQPERLSIASRILTEREQIFLNSLPPERQWGFLLINFSTKEAIFKALAPRLKRHIAFTEAEVFPTTHHSSDITLLLKNNSEFPREIKAQYTWSDKYVITSVQALWD